MDGDLEHLEREVKFRVTSASHCAAALRAAGSREVEGPAVEDDLLFDDAESTLSRRDEVIRLRRKRFAGSEPDGGGRLTFKGPARIVGGAREREEIETPVADAAAVAAILERLGLRPAFRYQKRRLLLRLDDALIAVDETPLGDFVEVEGSLEAIDRVGRLLGMERQDWLVGSYPALWREARGAEAGDMLLSEDDG